MNTRSTFKDNRKGPLRQVPGVVLLAVLAACGGGGGGGGEATASRGVSSPNMVSPGTSPGFINVATSQPSTSAPAPAAPAPAPVAPEPEPVAPAPAPVAPAPAPVAPAPAPAPVAPAPAPAPVAPFSCAAGAITCVEVASTSATTQTSLPVTFGQPFKAGDWLHSAQSLIAKVDGVTIPLQSDEISSHRDGSARFAVLSAQLNNVQPGQVRIINLYSGTKTTSTPNVPANPDWNLELEAQVFDANGNVTATLVALPQAQLKTQIGSHAGRRLAGTVASEYTVVTSFKDKSTGVEHPHLTARLHTRLVDGGGRIRTDVVMENTRTFTAGPGNITYALNIKRNGTTLHSQPKFTHYHHARWHKVVWSGAAPQPLNRVRHHMPYFMSTKATWNYNLNLKVPESTLASQATLINQKRQEQAQLGPMANMLLTPYFPMTGGRAEIGPLPRWTAQYLISQDDRALEAMLVNADAAGSVPIHYRDEGSDQPLDLDRYPKVSLNYGTSNPVLPTITNGATIWSPDTSHQASFAYVPYLVTGDAFYLDEIVFWAAWNIAKVNPDYREQGAGLIYPEQVRGQAWSMRSIGEAKRVLPDAHPLKSYYSTRLTNNLDWYLQKYPNNPTPSTLSPLGAIQKPDERTLTAPWQNDFMGIVFAQLVDDAEPQALLTLQWFSKFNVDRYLKESEGFCMAKAPGYYWKIRDANDQLISTWKGLFEANYPGITCSPTMAVDGYPDASTGYAATSRAMLASAHNAGITNAAQAYSLWVAKTPKMDAAMAADPTWAIVPRN